MGIRSLWIAIVLALVMVVGCEAVDTRRTGGARTLTGLEMDRITAGSAIIVDNAAARAFGSTPRAAVLDSVAAYSGSGPIASAPFLNYAKSTTVVSAGDGNRARACLSNYVSVSNANGGALIDAAASSIGTSQTQVSAQFFGISTNRADLVFGSVAGISCCGSDAGADIKVESKTGGPYSTELRSAPVSVSGTPGQVQNRVDIAVLSSALPILNPAEVSVARAPAIAGYGGTASGMLARAGRW
jgi:hypothetical protein